MGAHRRWFELALAGVMGAACAHGQGRADSVRDDRHSMPGASSRAGSGCAAPRGGTLLAAAKYTRPLCRRGEPPILTVRDESEFATRLACFGVDSVSLPSGVDWSKHELIVAAAWYQGDPARMTGVFDLPSGRMLQVHVPKYCGGDEPVSGEQIFAVLVARRDGVQTTMVRCATRRCDWDVDGVAPPA